MNESSMSALRMSQANFFKLCKWLLDTDLKKFPTFVALSDAAAKELGTHVSVITVKAALRATDRPFEPTQKKSQSDLSIVAKYLCIVMKAEGYRAPAELTRICGVVENEPEAEKNGAVF
jgi:hypothetical protein